MPTSMLYDYHMFSLFWVSGGQSEAGGEGGGGEGLGGGTVEWLPLISNRELWTGRHHHDRFSLLQDLQTHRS